jgi:glutathione S-transferase
VLVALVVWSHPYASYGQKVAIALYELGLAFEARLVDQADPAVMGEFRRVAPFAKFPVVVDIAAGRTIAESSVIIEYLDRLAGPRLIPGDPDAALESRYVDRVIDTYVGGPMNRIVSNKLRPAGEADTRGMAEDAGAIAEAWDVLEHVLADGRTWSAGEAFSLADCCAAPMLTYARRLVPFGHRPRLRAWHGRLLERPSFRRALADAAPFGDLMPAPPAID